MPLRPRFDYNPPANLANAHAHAHAMQRRYQRITSDDDTNGYDPRFEVPDSMNPKLRKPSWRTVALAFSLAFVGTVLLTCYALYATGHMPLPKNEAGPHATTAVARWPAGARTAAQRHVVHLGAHQFTGPSLVIVSAQL